MSNGQQSTKTLGTAYITVEPTADTPFRYFVQVRDQVGTVRHGTDYSSRKRAVTAAAKAADKLAAIGDYEVVRSF